MQSDRKLTSDATPAPQRRGGGGHAAKGGGGSNGGRGRARGSGSGGGGRGSRGASAASQDTPSQPPSDAARHGQPKSDKSKPPHRKSSSNGSGGGGSGFRGGGGGGGASSGRPARVTNLIMRKVLIRNIPHDWDEDKLVELIETAGAARFHVWRFVAGKVRANNRAPRPGRLYLDFKKDTELAKSVVQALHGHNTAASDTKDETKKLEVEFAPFQKIHREKQRKDAKVGTIDRDPEFVAFLEALAKPKEKLPSADLVADLKDTESAEKPVSALVLYLNTRKRDKKGSKHAGKASDKTRGTRVKTTKDGKRTKEKLAKGAKNKTKGTDATGSSKEPTKTRKVRGKSAPAPKEKHPESDQMEPGVFKVMSIKTREQQQPASAGAVESSSLAVAAAGGPSGGSESKGKTPAKGGSNKGQRRGGGGGGQQAQKDASSTGDAAGPAAAADAASERKGGGGGRGSREPRAKNGGPKSGGRGDQPKKVFAPKVTTPAG